MKKFLATSFQPSLTLIGAPIWTGKVKHGGNAFQEMMNAGFMQEIHKKRIFDMTETYTRLNLFRTIRNINSDFIVTVGGDQTISVSTMSAYLNRRPSTGMIWIDHHTPIDEGNIFGYEHGTAIYQLTHSNVAMDPTKIVRVGAAHGRFSVNEISQGGIDRVMYHVYRTLRDCEAIHVVFDIDVIDKIHAPCTEFPSTNGLTLQESKEMMQLVRKMFGHKFKSMDLVEVDTTVGSYTQFETSINTARQILISSL